MPVSYTHLGLFYVQDIADSEKDRFRQLQLDQAAGDLVLVPDIRKPLQLSLIHI